MSEEGWARVLKYACWNGLSRSHHTDENAQNVSKHRMVVSWTHSHADVHVYMCHQIHEWRTRHLWKICWIKTIILKSLLVNQRMPKRILDEYCIFYRNSNLYQGHLGKIPLNHLGTTWHFRSAARNEHDQNISNGTHPPRRNGWKPQIIWKALEVDAFELNFRGDVHLPVLSFFNGSIFHPIFEPSDHLTSITGKALILGCCQLDITLFLLICFVLKMVGFQAVES